MTIYILDRGRALPSLDRFALVILRDDDPLPMEEGTTIHWQGHDLAAAKEVINRMRQTL